MVDACEWSSIVVTQLCRNVRIYNSWLLYTSLKQRFYSSVRILYRNSCFNIVRRPCSIFCVHRLKFVIFTLQYTFSYISVNPPVLLSILNIDTFDDDICAVVPDSASAL